MANSQAWEQTSKQAGAVVSDSRRFAHELGVALREARTAKGRTQQELADEIGVTRASIANLEAGRQRMSAYYLALAANALGVNPIDLLPKPGTAETPQTPGNRVLKNLPASHRDLVTRLLASAAHEGDSDGSS